MNLWELPQTQRGVDAAIVAWDILALAWKDRKKQEKY
jgi:hypothetical protein